jgi:hypothetical protein
MKSSSQSLRVASGHQQARMLVHDRLTASADVAGDGGNAHGGRLHDRTGESLSMAGKHEDVHGGVQLDDVRS